MEKPFPDGNREENHLYKAFELIESERMAAMLSKHGIHREIKVVQYEFLKKSAKWWMAAAAVVVVLLVAASCFIYLNITPQNPQRLANNALSTVVSDYNFSYRSSGLLQHLSEIQKSFNNSQWALAASQLDAALEKTDVTDTNTIIIIYFYQGIIALKENDFNKAILSFTSVCDLNSGDLQNDAVWLRGLAHIKNNNFEAAKADLILTTQITGWKKADEAAKILQSISDENLN